MHFSMQKTKLETIFRISHALHSAAQFCWFVSELPLPPNYSIAGNKLVLKIKICHALFSAEYCKLKFAMHFSVLNIVN